MYCSLWRRTLLWCDRRPFLTMRLRLAKPVDAAAIADIYHACNVGNPQSFMLRLGRRFLCCYYRITLGARESVVLCAENPAGEIMGFASGTIDASALLRTLRRARWSLLFAAAGSVTLHPGLLPQMWRRGRNDGNEYIISTGARWEYWAWHPRFKGTSGAIALQRAWLNVMRGLGVRKVGLEVNADDEKVAFLHRSCGAKLVRETITPAGITRLFLEYDLP